MNSGSYAACTGLRAQMQALELVAHNLANLGTNGYRAEQPVFESMLAAQGALLNPLNRAINNYGVLGDSRVDLSSGSLERTGNLLDVGIEGGGFFVVQTARGTRYTRNGNFTVSGKHQLTTASGDLVLGEAGPIPVPAGTLAISADGTLSVDGAITGKLKIVEFAANSRLESEGNSMYSAPETGAVKARGSAVRQGVLEASNVNPMAAMVALIAVQRQAEMLQRTLSMFYSELDHTAAGELPRV
ncbi:MAG TPA: flagellar basal-body rod protein FlgF [Terriglobales bacterium]|nr:flagellar basal-body rod protein FlgF [Terriglobales bacterium]